MYTKICKYCNNKFDTTNNSREYCCRRCSNIDSKKLIYGRGINDSLEPVKVNDKHINSYKVWRSMFNRCYGNNDLPHIKAYRDVDVCKDWCSYSKFLEWYNDNYVEGYVLDKDICNTTGIKLYCAENCNFVPQEINKIFRASKVHFINKKPNKNGKYNVRLSLYGEDTNIGYYDTIEEAFQVYKKAKEAYIKEVATNYYTSGKINERVYQALMKYEVEITD